MISIQELKSKSGLPGPRGNLSLMYQYLESCSLESANECLAVIQTDTSNSPEEFVGMCGVAGFALVNFADKKQLIEHLRKYSQHSSWRIREAVAIAIQELPIQTLEERLRITQEMEAGDPLVHRAIVAGLCEPKNLKGQIGICKVYDHLVRATLLFEEKDKLTDGEESLKKALGYCWSVALAEHFEDGKSEFDKLITNQSKHVRWILKENLKKNRLLKKNKEWVGEKIRQLTSCST